MPKRYPQLTLAEVRSILKFNGFEVNNTVGSHQQWVGMIGGERRRVTVDISEAPFDDFLIKSMIRQSGVSRDDFYASTKATAKKVGLSPR